MTHPQKKLTVEVAKTMFGYTIYTRAGRLHVDPEELDDLIELLSFWQEPDLTVMKNLRHLIVTGELLPIGEDSSE